ncbi:unnamed protein product [Camellia sinensis]
MLCEQCESTYLFVTKEDIYKWRFTCETITVLQIGECILNGYSLKVSSSQKIGVVGKDRRPRTKAPASDNPSTARQYDHLRNYDSIRNLSSGFMTEESSPDAASKKELGNEFFKQKKFKEAIDCYSRSIALSPTAVSYANRGMAYLKIRRFQVAEDDCTEALNLDDRYIKAYSRRSTARKELGKLKESMEDAEFAMRLEPLNQEIKKQYAEAKSLYEKFAFGNCKCSWLKMLSTLTNINFGTFMNPDEEPAEILKKASGSLKNSMQGVQKEGKSKVEGNGRDGGIQSVSSSSHKMGAAAIQGRNKDKLTVGRQKREDKGVYEELIPAFDGLLRSKICHSDHSWGSPSTNAKFMDSDGQVPARTPMSVVEAESKSKRGKGREADASSDDAMQSSGMSNSRNHKKQELKASVQELAAQAASLAKIEAAKNITPPNSAYQFEVSWRGLAGDHTLQARLLKVTSPVALPQIFKNALSAPILIEIIRCIVTFFCEEMDLAVKYLENLAKVSRFDMIIMCLSSTDKTGISTRYGMIYFAAMQPQWSMRRGLINCSLDTAPNNDAADENLEHMFFQCPDLQRIWRGSPLGLDFNFGAPMIFTDWLENWRRDRNSVASCDNPLDCHQTIALAKELHSSSFKERLVEDEDKFVVDGSWRAADQSAGIAWVCYNGYQEKVAHRSAKLVLPSTFAAEAKACLDALQWAREKGMLCIIICTDSQQLLAALKENSNVDWLLSTIIKDICYYGRYFNVIIVSKVDRSVVKPTHNLAYCVNDFPT